MRGRAMPRRLAPLTWAGAQAKCDQRPMIPFDFVRRDPPPRPAPTRGAGVRAPVSSNEVGRRPALNSQ